jgi:hypothetical protein
MKLLATWRTSAFCAVLQSCRATTVDLNSQVVQTVAVPAFGGTCLTVMYGGAAGSGTTFTCQVSLSLHSTPQHVVMLCAAGTGRGV